MVGNDLEVFVDKAGDISLVLASRFELVLNDTFNLPSFRRNLILVSCLDKLGFTFTFSVRKINLMLNSQIVGFGSSVDGLYKLSLDPDNVSSSLVESFVAKRSKIEEKIFCVVA